MNPYSKIITIDSHRKGKTVALFAGIHGNEMTGVHVLDYLSKNIKLSHGKLHLVYANLPALEKSVRYENKNLNRLFLRDQEYETYEDTIAHDLMNLLDECDVLLDLHAYSQKEGGSVPFVICEPDAFPYVQNMSVPYTLSGLHEFQRGSTDQYMYFNNKIGICIELGSRQKPHDFVELGIESSRRFLENFNMINNHSTSLKNTEVDITHLRAVLFYKKVNENFVFMQKYKTFDRIKGGSCIAHDGRRSIMATSDSYILFPNSDQPVGSEVFILAEEI